MTSHYHIIVSFNSSIPDYVRAPVVVEDLESHKMRLFSDFRAPHNRVHLKVMRRVTIVDSDGRSRKENGEILYDGIAVMNAVEYAYEADLGGLTAQEVRARLGLGEGKLPNVVQGTS